MTASPLATCDRLIADAPPVRCDTALLWYISASPTARFDSLLVAYCPECGQPREATGILHEAIPTEGV